MFKLGFEELKNQFDRELARKDSLESKASYIVGFTSIILPLLFSILLELLNDKSLIFVEVKSYILGILITNITLIFITLIITIYILDITNVNYPLPSSNPNELNNFYFNNADLGSDLKDYYFGCISNLNIQNNKKANFLSLCFKLILVSSILIFIMFMGVLL